jgi:hypothetical protein
VKGRGNLDPGRFEPERAPLEVDLGFAFVALRTDRRR